MSTPKLLEVIEEQEEYETSGNESTSPRQEPVHSTSQSTDTPPPHVPAAGIASSAAIPSFIASATVESSNNGDGTWDGTESPPPPTIGWITLQKDGTKLVSSRLRLDMVSRQQHQQQWARRVGHDRSFGLLDRNLVEGRASSSSLSLSSTRAFSSRDLKSSVQAREKELSRYSLELSAGCDATSFAFGGVHPGILHAHGRLYDWHKVSYSIGVAGEYLLHVRLRSQAAALPGSPFLLRVEPGAAFALTSRLPPGVIASEVGESAKALLRTGDRMGNQCDKGNGAVTAMCDGGVTASFVDLADGTCECLPPHLA